MTWTVPHLQHWMVSLSQVPPAFQAQHHSVPIQATQRQPRSSNLQPVGRCLSGEARSPSAASPPSDTQARLTLRHTGCWNRRGPSPCRDRCFLFFQLLPPLPSPSLSPQPISNWGEGLVWSCNSEPTYEYGSQSESDGI